MKDIIIIGCGGLGIETAELIREIDDNAQGTMWNILGFLDDNEKLHGMNLNGHKVLGGVNLIETEYKGVDVAIAIADTTIRRNIALSIQSFCKFPIIIHPSVTIPASSIVGRGTIICTNSVISVNVIIGEFVIINPKCGIGHGANVRSFSTLMWNVNISGDVAILPMCTLGTNCTILQSLTLNSRCTIGAGAVVTKDVKSKAVMIGVPAKRLSYYK